MDLLLTILISASILIFGFAFIYAITYCLRINGYFNHNVQFILTILSFVCIVSFTYVAFGTQAVSYLMNGLFIGLGLALQPMMKTITKGFVFDGTRLSKFKGQIDIVGKNIKGTIHTVGMLHTWIKDNNGCLYMVSNDILNQEILKIHPLKTSTSESSAESYVVKQKTRLHRF